MIFILLYCYMVMTNKIITDINITYLILYVIQEILWTIPS